MSTGTPDRRQFLLELAQAAGEGVVSVPGRWLAEALEPPPAVQIDLTVPQLAVLFSKAESTVRGWLEAGAFEGAYRLHGKQWRAPPSSVTAFQARQATPSEANGDLSAWRRVAVLRPKHV